MFWPDDTTLARQPWWAEAAWLDGPTYGELVSSLRPVLRVAALHGYSVDAINIGFGPGPVVHGDWQSIDLDTLELLPGASVSPDLPDEGPGIWLDVAEIDDLAGQVAAGYATGLDFPLFAGGYTDDHSVPPEIRSDIAAFVDAAIADLTSRVPDSGGVPRDDGGGLLWVFDARHWHPTDAMLQFWIQLALNQMYANPTGFLRGQVYADRDLHAPGAGAGPPNLLFLMGGAAAEPAFDAGSMHRGVWSALTWHLQVTGAATRLFEAERRLYRGASAPVWLDVVLDLVLRGVILIDGLVDPGEPPEPIAAEQLAASGDAVDAVRLWIWGDTPVTLRRRTVFPEQGGPGLESSVAWDYVPGDSQVRPTVLLVAGRGVAIEHRIDPAVRRPWDLRVHRVQDDALVPPLGSMIDTALLLAGTQIEPYDEECVGPVTDEYLAGYPQLFVKPKPDGVLLVYPTSPDVIPDTVGGPTTGFVPAVVELTVEPGSGTHAYAVDVRYFTGRFMDMALGGPFRGGAHVTVWVTEGVTITSNLSDNDTPAAGNPSVLSGTVDGHLFVVELHVTDRPDALPRPWRADLPLTPWAVAAPPTFWTAVFQEMWGGLAPESVQDLFPGDRDHPFAEPEPEPLEYDTDLRRADWFDETAQEFVGLTPAPHSYRQYGYLDSLLMDAADIALGFVPYVGDIADVGEAAYAYQTGLDRWGRPVTRFQLALMLVGAAVPVVSSRFVVRVGETLAGLLRAAPPQELARPVTVAELAPLGRGADWHDDLPIEQVHAAMGEPSPLRAVGAAGDLGVSPARRELSRELAQTLAADLGPIPGLADDLLAGRYRGWLTTADLLTDDQAYGFVTSSLEIPYLRALRRDPGLRPTVYIEGLQ
ncbi:hypothetical protein [Micromonospora sp. NPDC126480]|uniref:hypothetical protein n=1 Tax=Micromonospora sp. NPDC126480 TaxID=3155312 RepID=UPI0033302F91